LIIVIKGISHQIEHSLSSLGADLLERGRSLLWNPGTFSDQDLLLDLSLLMPTKSFLYAVYF